VLRKLDFLLYILITVILLLGPLWLTLDFKRVKLVPPDSFYMLPDPFWPIVIILLGLLFYFVYRGDVSLVPLIAAYLILIFPYIQWPIIFGWDQYLHTAIANDAAMGNVAKSAYTIYGLSYPGSYILMNTVRYIIGMDYLYVATILSLIVRIASLIMIYILIRILFNDKLTYVAFSLFLLSNYRFADYFQFSPQAHALPMFLLSLCLCLKPISRNGLAVVVLLVFSIVITHIFTSILMLTTFLGLYFVSGFFQSIKRRQLLFLSALGLITWFSWHTHVAVNIIEQGSIHLHNAFTDVTEIYSLITELVSSASTFGRNIYNEILLRYRQGFLLFIVASALIGSIFGFKEHKVRLFIGVLFGTMLFSFALIILSEPPSRIWLDRVVLLGLVTPVILATYCLARLFKKKEHFVKILSYVCILLIPLSFFADFQTVYLYAVKDWEKAPSAILFTYPNRNLDITSDSISLIFLRYLSSILNRDYIFTGYVLNRFLDNPASLYEVKQLLSSSLILRSYRQKVDWFYNQGIETSSWDRLDNVFSTNFNFTKIYDNDYAQIYFNSLK